MLPNVSKTLKRSFKISESASSRVLWICFIWCDSFSSRFVISVAFGTECLFFSYPHSNTRTRLQKYVSIYVHMHTERQIQSDSALHFSCLISFQSFSTVPLPYLTFLKPPFPHCLFQCWGTEPLTKLGHLHCLLRVTLSWKPFCRSGGQPFH